ncbi:MAG: NIL domain-containing protein [Chloroflexota bacterium]|nr:NIL domain-containing protein [Chloroflexota bacterium]
MVNRQVMLTFSPETSPEPIVYNIGQQFNIVTNIRQADATDDKGWIVIELTGNDKDIEAAIAWATSRGVRVDPVTGESLRS